KVRTDPTHEQLHGRRVDVAVVAEFARPAERKTQQVNPPPGPGGGANAVKILDPKQEAAGGHGVLVFASTIARREKPCYHQSLFEFVDPSVSWRPIRLWLRSFHLLPTRTRRGSCPMKQTREFFGGPVDGEIEEVDVPMSSPLENQIPKLTRDRNGQV